MLKEFLFGASISAFLLIIFSLSSSSQHLTISPFNFTPPQCNITHWEYITNVSWAKGDFLNKTFARINSKVQPLRNVTWKVNDTVTYLIFNTSFSFSVLDKNQTAQILGKDTVVIEDSFTEVTINFNYTKYDGSSSKSGFGIAKGVSQELMVALKIDANEGQMKQRYFDNMDYFLAQLTLTTTDKWINQDQKEDLITLLNKRFDKGPTVRQQLISYVKSVYVPNIKLELENQNKIHGQSFTYRWVKNKYYPEYYVEINFTRNPQSFYFENRTFFYAYQATIDNFKNFRCGPQPELIKKFDSRPPNLMEYISWTFWENLANYGMEQGFLNGNMSKDNWNTNFSYNAKSVYDIINNTEQFAPDTPITGTCKGLPKQTKIRRYDSIYAQLTPVNVTYNCQFFIQNITILNFNINMTLEVYPQIDKETKQILYTIYNYRQNYKLLDVPGGFFVFNKSKLDQIVWDHFENFYHYRLFGSGFPLYLKFPNPEIFSYNSSTIVYN